MERWRRPFLFPLFIPTAMTKWQVLSAVSAIYEPMVFLVAVTITAKVLLPDGWHVGHDLQPDGRRPKKLEWNHPLPPALQERFCFAKSLESFQGLRVPRCLWPASFPNSYTTITSTSSAMPHYPTLEPAWSSKASAAKIALRLVAVQSRVVPVEEQTLTRLELMAALLGAGHIKSYLHQLQLPC
jgi:hypothetical protein